MPLSVRLLLESQLHEVRGVRIEQLLCLRACHRRALFVLDALARLAENQSALHSSFLGTHSSSLAKQFSERRSNRHSNSKTSDNDASNSSSTSAAHASERSDTCTRNATSLRG